MLKNQINTLVLSAALVLLLLSSGTAIAQSNSTQKDKFMKPVNLGLRYQVQEFQILNQKLNDNCNCDEDTRLMDRALIGLAASIFQPIGKHWALGVDLGSSKGSVMDDNRVYKKYELSHARIDGFYHFLKESARIRPYFNAGVQMAGNSDKTFYGVPLGAGLRYKFTKGGYLHIQTAYDGGISNSLAKSTISNVGFHVPIRSRKKVEKDPPVEIYEQVQIAKADSSKKEIAPVVKPVETVVAQVVKPDTVKKEIAPVVKPVEPIVAEVKKPEPVVVVEKIVPAVELLRVVYFDVDKYSLNKPETAKVLAEVLEFLKTNPNTSVKLSGHTDGVLSQAYNLVLSQKRVQAVNAWLISKGINAKRISKEFFGKDKPVSANDDVVGRANNRRVEIMIK
jgi:outer membrane protein OmpA-like peptidoglycan-associated protein